MLLGLKCFHRISFIICTRKWRLIFCFCIMLRLKVTILEKNINLIINNSINVSKLHIIRKKRYCTFRCYASHLQFYDLNFVNFLRFYVIVGLRFFGKILYYVTTLNKLLMTNALIWKTFSTVGMLGLQTVNIPVVFATKRILKCYLWSTLFIE